MGIKEDPSFGPVVLFGSGGVLVELLKDVSLRVAPVSESNIKGMIESTKAFKLLSGFRGSAPSDIDAVKECLCRLSQLALDFPEISELDMNPLLVFEKGCSVIDARIMVKIK